MVNRKSLFLCPSILKFLNFFCSTLILLLSAVSPYAQETEKQIAKQSKQDPIELKAVLSLESAHLVNANSAQQASEQRAVLVLPLSLDTQDFLSVNAGTIELQGMMIKEDPTLSAGRPLLNDYHAYSNLRAEDRIQLFEMYWEKTWPISKGFGRGTTRIGKIDANDHFAVSDHESYLLNGASGYSPSIFALPSYPDSAWHLSHEQDFKSLVIKLGIFDGGSTSLEGTPTGKSFGLSPSAQRGELFYIVESTIFWGSKKHVDRQVSMNETLETEILTSVQQDRDFEMRAPFHLSLGLWKTQAKVVEFNDQPKDSYGVYLVGDFKLAHWQKYGDFGIGFQMAHSPDFHPLHASLAMIWDQIGSPLAWASQKPSLSLGFSYLNNSDEITYSQAIASREEELVELTFALPLSDSLLINLSWMTLMGEHLPQGIAHLVVSRLTIGAL